MTVTIQQINEKLASARRYQGRVQQFDGLGKDTADWRKMRDADLEDLFKMINTYIDETPPSKGYIAK